MPGIEVLAQPQLSIVIFRCVRPELSNEELDRINRELLERVNARKRVYLTGTVAHGRFVARLCILSFRTHRERIEMALEDIQAAAAELPAETPARRS